MNAIAIRTPMVAIEIETIYVITATRYPKVLVVRRKASEVSHTRRVLEKYGWIVMARPEAKETT